MTGLRAALSGLTTRGRCLLAAGCTLLLCSLALGQRDLLRTAVFLIALPICATVIVGRTRYRLSGSRHLDPVRVEVGRPATVHLELSNLSRLPTGRLLIEDLLPYTLGGRPRFVVERIDPSASRQVTYPVQALDRGSYRIGPLSVRLTDPFGLCELARGFTAVDDLVVTPVITALPGIRLGGDWLGGGEASARSISTSGSDDVATREYRYGDDLRKVHWRSTARVGELMVRREEQPFQSRATLLLDTRNVAHRGTGPGSSFEWSVSAVASMAVALGRAGFALRLMTSSGQPLTPAAVSLTEGAVLDALALVQQERLSSLDPAVSHLRGNVDGVLIATLGIAALADIEKLARLRSGTGTCIAVLLDADAWAPLGAKARAEAKRLHHDGADLLRSAGWRVLLVAPGADLAQLWPHAAGRIATRSASR